MRKISNRLKIGSFILGVGFFLATPLFAQNGEGPSEQEILTNYSLFSEYYRNDNFKDSEQYMNWLRDHIDYVFQVGALKSGTRPTTLLKRFRTTLEELGNASEGVDKLSYMEAALDIYENGPSTLKDLGKEVDEYDWIFDTGRFIQTHLSIWPEREDAIIEKYSKCFEMDPERLDDYYKMLLVQDVIKRDDKEGAIQLMDEMEPYASEQTLQQFDVYRNALFSSPEERINFLEGQLEKKAGTDEELDLIEELFALYRRQGYLDEAKAMGEKLATMNPSIRLYRLLAQFELDEGNTEAAINYFEQLTEMTDDPDEKAEFLYNVGTLHYQESQYRSAVEYANKAMTIVPGLEKAQDLKIKAYAGAASSCGCTSLACRAIYWVLPGYGRYAPSSEEYFFEGWRPGMSVRVGGCMSWTGLTATVR